MEDKSPFFTSGAEFKAPDSDSEEEVTVEASSGKKKKNLVSQLWKRLFSKEEDQPKEEQKGFLESFGAFFSKFSGIERDEIDEPEEVEPAEDMQQSPDFRFPLLGSMDVASTANMATDTGALGDTAEGASVENNKVDFNEVELPVPSDNRIDESQDPASVDYMPKLPYEQVRPGYDEVPVQQQVLDRNRLGDEDGGSLAPSVDLGSVSAERNEPVITERETIIEQRGGAGAALLGAVVANRLSKSRDRKIQADAKQLEKKVETLQKAEKRDSYDVERLRIKSQQQAEQLRLKREDTVPEQSQSRQEVVINKEVSKNHSLESQPKLEKYPKIFESTASQLQERAHYAAEKPEIRSNIELDPVVLEQIEKAAEQNVALERHFERRHEVKDVPTNNSASQTGVNLGITTVQQQVASDDATRTTQQLVNLEQERRRSQQTRDNYQQAATQGIVAGIILLVSFGIIAFIWSLLN